MWLMFGAVTFSVPHSARLVILCKYTPTEFTIIKSWATTLSRSPQCRVFSRAAMDVLAILCRWGGGGGQWLQMTGALYRHAKYLNTSTRMTLSALIRCYFNYSSSSWFGGLCKALKHKLQVTQNKELDLY